MIQSHKQQYDVPDRAVSGSAPIALESLTGEQQKAAKFILGGNSCFVTGAAGTGKSFLLTYVIQELSRKHSAGGEVVVTAPTGKS